MRLEVKAYPSARKERIIEENGRFKVYTSVPPDKGKANQKILKMLAKHLGIKRSQLKIIKGVSSRIKIIEVVE